MNNILKIMDSDHKVIENLIRKIKSESTNPITIFYDIKNKLLQHFAWEEEILFPEFESRAGSYGTGIIYILKGEHKQI
jgi:iron-sulfur cluster repair protein YtfE (RIC family)